MLKVQNIHDTDLGFGAISIPPEGIATIPDKFFHNGVLDLYVNKNRVKILESRLGENEKSDLPSYRVRFYDSNATLLLESSVTQGEDAEIPQYTPPEGYVIDKWTTSKSGTRKAKFTNINNNVNAYARIVPMEVVQEDGDKAVTPEECGEVEESTEDMEC